MKKIFSILFALVLLLSLGLATAAPVLAGTIIHVPGDYPSIEWALNASSDGDTIMVAAGEYDAFMMNGKTNINIISTEGATVTGALYHALHDAFIMAVVAQSENINIEGIDFDGTNISGGEVWGILYLDSTGRISDLTVENVVGNTTGAGVVILDKYTLSNVEITSSTISNNDIGIWVLSNSTQEAHLNNIVGNTYYGVRNDGGETVDATHNWWGHASGPYHESLNPGGGGDEVSDGVDFEPWLEAASVTQTVENATFNAIDEADIQIVVTGKATLTISRYESNPHPEALGDGGVASLDLLVEEPYEELEDLFRDVCVIDYEPGTEIELRLYYTDVEAEDFDEPTLRLFWHDEGTNQWVRCSPSAGDSGVNMTDITIESHHYSGYIWAKITESTTPSLDGLQGDEFGGYGHPSETNGGFCFIATAAYGTDTAEQLDILREFRDAVLLPNSLGARFVSLYYKTSPPLADFISQYEVLRTAVRVGFVDPIVKMLTCTHNLWSARAS